MSSHDSSNRFPVRRRFRVPGGLAPSRSDSVEKDASETNPSSTGSPIAPKLLPGSRPGLSSKQHALLKACLVGDAEGVRAALKNGARPNFVSDATEERGKTCGYDRTPLMVAAAAGNVEILRLLLDAGADPALKTVEGASALTAAAADGRTAVVDVLVDQGVAIDYLVLRVCVTMNRGTETLKHLVSRGADIDAVGKAGRTLLHHAAERLNARLLRDLLAMGANPNLQDAFGATAMHHVLGHGDTPDERDVMRQCAGMLLSAGADATIKDRSDRSFIDLIGERPDMIRVLRDFQEGRLADRGAAMEDSTPAPAAPAEKPRRRKNKGWPFA